MRLRESYTAYCSTKGGGEAVLMRLGECYTAYCSTKGGGEAVLMRLRESYTVFSQEHLVSAGVYDSSTVYEVSSMLFTEQAKQWLAGCRQLQWSPS